MHRESWVNTKHGESNAQKTFNIIIVNNTHGESNAQKTFNITIVNNTRAYNLRVNDFVMGGGQTVKGGPIYKNNLPQTVLLEFERKILGRVCGPICKNGRWIKRQNQELYALFKHLENNKFIKLSILRWAGHVMKMED